MSKRKQLHDVNIRAHSEGGFSIIEIAVIVTLALLLLSISVLYFGKARSRYSLSQNAQKIVSQIERARSLAIKYNQTLTLGFTLNNSVLTLTCADCAPAKTELPAYVMPTGVTLSTYPSISIRGNGTITTANNTIVANDGQGRQVTITISNSGRTTVGDISETN